MRPLASFLAATELMRARRLKNCPKLPGVTKDHKDIDLLKYAPSPPTSCSLTDVAQTPLDRRLEALYRRRSPFARLYRDRSQGHGCSLPFRAVHQRGASSLPWFAEGRSADGFATDAR